VAARSQARSQEAGGAIAEPLGQAAAVDFLEGHLPGLGGLGADEGLEDDEHPKRRGAARNRPGGGAFTYSFRYTEPGRPEDLLRRDS